MFDSTKLNEFEWDNSNLVHVSKHKVSYKECEEIFLNKPFFVNKDETHSQIEERFRVYGKTEKERFLIVIFTIRKNKIRIISARDQSKKERKEYQKRGGENK